MSADSEKIPMACITMHSTWVVPLFLTVAIWLLTGLVSYRPMSCCRSMPLCRGVPATPHPDPPPASRPPSPAPAPAPAPSPSSAPHYPYRRRQSPGGWDRHRLFDCDHVRGDTVPNLHRNQDEESDDPADDHHRRPRQAHQRGPARESQFHASNPRFRHHHLIKPGDR